MLHGRKGGYLDVVLHAASLHLLDVLEGLLSLAAGGVEGGIPDQLLQVLVQDRPEALRHDDRREEQAVLRVIDHLAALVLLQAIEASICRLTSQDAAVLHGLRDLLQLDLHGLGPDGDEGLGCDRALVAAQWQALEVLDLLDDNIAWDHAI